jgi:N-acetyl-anhydromuramyl-L-alanine amidase AmpD
MTHPELIINGLTLAAGGALIVERVTEFLKHIQKRFDREQAEQRLLQVELAELRQANLAAEQILAGEVPTPVNEPDDREQYAPVPVIDRARLSLNSARVRLFVRLAPLALGLIIAGVLDLHLLALMRGAEVLPMAQLWADGQIGQALLQWLDTLLSGVFIAGGSQPVHVLIRFLRARPLPAPVPEEDSEVSAANVGDGPTDSQPAPLRYQGGVKPLTLEQVHKRSGDPQQIVVHHTAMNANTSFATIVDEFLVNKGWLTGYHAVIMPDGQIHAFCRWDRRGNHARGHNDRTLGIAFHGNFHTDPADAYANHDGRYGPQQPSEAQLDAGARLIAAWIHLYPQMDGIDDVVAHRELSGASTVCPGNQFPLTQLRQGVGQWLKRWHQPQHQALLAALAQQPRIYCSEQRPAWLTTEEMAHSEEVAHG